MLVPSVMAGGGEYDRHSAAQTRDARSHLDLVTAAADAVASAHLKEAFVIADYGCAQGQASDPLIRAAIERVRASLRDVPIMVVHNDQLGNDWAGFFARLAEPDAYPGTPGGAITPLASATSFYEPVTPPGDVDLGMSFAAIQWLSEPGPPGTGGALFFDQLDGAPRAAMAEQAHADWTRFLALRATELAPGGRLVLDMMGRHEDGSAAAHDLWRVIAEAGDHMARDGLLERRRLDDYVVPLYERTLDEVRRPFDEGIGERLRLERLAIHDAPHPALERFAATGDGGALAREMTGFCRAFSEPALRAALGLDEPGVDDLYGRIEALVRDGAADFSFTVHPITVVIVGRD